MSLKIKISIVHYINNKKGCIGFINRFKNVINN